MRKVSIVVVTTLALIIIPINSHAAANILWNSATVLKGQITIPADQKVTVAANTKIVVQNGTRITILGSLNAPAGLTLSGKSWVGLVVTGNAVLTNFHESGASTSFQVGPLGSLRINGGSISGVAGASVVEGTFVASGLHYDKGMGSGINSNNETGSITIDRSVLTGSGRNSGDFFGLYGVKSIKLTNSQMSGSHCAFHVLGIQNLKLDHDNISGNSYGFMMYGSSSAGVKTITNTTIKNNLFGFDEGSASTHNGPILISNSTITGNDQNLGLYTGSVKIVSK